MLTIQSLIKALIVASNNSDLSLLDIELIAVFGLNIKSREELLLQYEHQVSEAALPRCLKLLERRLKNEPIAYITSTKEFWDYTFFVDPSVLIPRPESELLIELALKYFPDKNSNLRILDLGTGSGCLILTLLKIFKNSFGVAVDISKSALNVAKINAERLEVTDKVEFLESNWFSNITGNKKFDIILANPPYIPIDEWNNLSDSVKHYEPKVALTDDSDGFLNYRNLAEGIGDFLNTSGFAVIECGYNQAGTILEIMLQNKNNVSVIEVAKDLAGINRALVLRCRHC